MDISIRSERTEFFEPNNYICMVVELNGSMKREAIQQAVNIAYTKNETTMSKIVMDEKGNGFYEPMKESGCKVFQDNRSWQDVIKESEKRPFRIDQGEMIRTYILTSAVHNEMEIKEGAENNENIESADSASNQTITLLIMAHHLVGDGKSILIFIEDICKSLNGENIKFKTMVHIDEEYLIKRAKFPWYLKGFVRRLNNKWNKTGRVFSWDDYYRLHETYWKEHSSQIEVESYDVRELKKECKQVTLNSYLITKLLQRYPGERVVGLPISIREQNYAMCNQTSGTSTKCKYDFHKSFNENAYKIHKKIYKKLNSTNHRYFVLLFLTYLEPTLIDSVLLNTYGCYENKVSNKLAYIMGYLGKGGTDLGITNLTQITIPDQYDHFSLQNIIFIPPKVTYANKIYGISTYKNKLTITYHNMQ